MAQKGPLKVKRLVKKWLPKKKRHLGKKEKPLDVQGIAGYSGKTPLTEPRSSADLAQEFGLPFGCLNLELLAGDQTASFLGTR